MSDRVNTMEEKDIIPFQDPKALAEFLNQPEVKIAELVTGALAMGRSEAVLMGGRLIQGALKGNLMRQVGRELMSLQKSGRIEADYAKEKFAFQTLAELLGFIDSEAPDQDRFMAIKALFYSIIDKNATTGSEILRYQLFQICKKLNSSQLLTLKACNELKKRGVDSGSAEVWLADVAKEVGHNSKGLVENDETTLEQEKLISGRTYDDRSGIRGRDARLTDLGIALVETILNYENFAD